MQVPQVLCTLEQTKAIVLTGMALVTMLMLRKSFIQFIQFIKSCSLCCLCYNELCSKTSISYITKFYISHMWPDLGKLTVSTQQVKYILLVHTPYHLLVHTPYHRYTNALSKYSEIWPDLDNKRYGQVCFFMAMQNAKKPVQMMQDLWRGL